MRVLSAWQYQPWNGLSAHSPAMQAASAIPRGVQIHGPKPERHAFLPLQALLSGMSLLGLAVQRNQGKGRTHVFVGEL